MHYTALHSMDSRVSATHVERSVHYLIHFPCGQVVVPGEGDVQEAFVIAKIKVHLRCTHPQSVTVRCCCDPTGPTKMNQVWDSSSYFSTIV